MKTLLYLFESSKHSLIIPLVALIVLISLLSPQFQTPASAAGNNCITSGPSGGAYTVKPCFTSPADGATVSGDQTVVVNVTVTGTNPGISKLIFNLNGQYLITDFQSPFTFVLPTGKFVDGSQVLSVAVTMKDGFISQTPSSIALTFNNGVTTITGNNNPFNPTSGTTPQPGQPFVVAAAGDGADGTTFAGSVTSQIASWNPNLFLYLGDVYDDGTSTEFSNWYGISNTFYGLFRSITDPVVGNHEYTNSVAPGYFDYWGKFPNSTSVDYSYYSFDASGWHFIALNSNCSILLICGVGQQEYQWLQNDLSTHNNICTIAYFHHPVFNTGQEGPTPLMNPIWALLAQNGVDIVLNGHEHQYQRWMPLDGSGIVNPNGITEFIAGGGGHGTTPFLTSDNRMVIGLNTTPSTLGALRLQLNQYGANYQYINYAGSVLDSGVVPCSGAPVDTIAPSTPANLVATPSSLNANLSWTASTDSVGVAGYDIYRNGSFLTSVGPVTSYSDTNLTSGTTYTYQILARDAAGNISGFSNTATATISLLFSDGFESGNFSAWTSNLSTTLSLQQTDVHSGTWAARATSSGSASSYAYETFGTAQSNLYYNLWFKVLSQGSTSAYLQRFRTSINNGPIGGVFINSTGKLAYHNDVAGTTTTSTITVTQNGWHQLETHLSINGASGLIEVWYDGVQVASLSKTDNFGSNAIARIQLGDLQPTDVYNIAFDDIGANASFINIPTPTPTPTVTPTATSTATNTSTATPTQTNTPVPLSTNTPTPTPTNTPLPAATNTPTSVITSTPTSVSSLLFSDGFESGNFTAWTSNLSTTLSLQQTDVHSGAWAARATSSGSASSYAYETFGTAQSNLYYNLWFKVLSQGSTSAYLQRFRASPNIAIGGVFINSTGKLAYHNDFAGTTTTSTIAVTQNGWHQLETHMNINGTSGLIEVWYDGVQVASLSKTDNFGTAPISRIQLGDLQPTDVYNIAFDDIGVSASFLGTPSPTPTSTSLPAATNTPTSTATPTNTSIPVFTNTPTATPTNTSAPLSTNTPTPTPTNTSLAVATDTPTATVTPGSTNTPTPTPTSNLSPTFTPVADAYVDSSNPGANFGTSTSLRVDSSPVVNSYLRFTVPALSGSSVSQARLLIFANSSSTQGLTAFTVADNTWGEKTISFSNAPALGSALSSPLPVTTGTWVTFDVTSYITGVGTFSFGLSTPGSTAISLAARESGAHSPQLIITMNP